MGKTSGLVILLLMVNLIGYISMNDYVTAYPDTAGSNSTALTANNPLLGLYSSSTQPDGTVQYGLTNDSTLYYNTPTEPPEGFFSGVFTFIDRIFIVFDWVRAIIAIALFPITLLTMLGLPWQLAMLLGLPLGTLYIFGIIDIFSSGGT
jgi:hypothetical protein